MDQSHSVKCKRCWCLLQHPSLPPHLIQIMAWKAKSYKTKRTLSQCVLLEAGRGLLQSGFYILWIVGEEGWHLVCISPGTFCLHKVWLSLIKVDICTHSCISLGSLNALTGSWVILFLLRRSVSRDRDRLSKAPGSRVLILLLPR